LVLGNNMKFDTNNLKYLSEGWFISEGYNAIKRIYGNSAAKRSEVPYINHINEGLKILSFIDAYYWTAYAYCLHPIMQDDKLFSSILDMRESFISYPSILAVEYRHAANSFLSHHKKQDYRPSIFPEVKQMLIADKIQNRKDFEIYHKNSHPNSARLTEYFQEWMEILDISEGDYIAITKALT